MFDRIDGQCGVQMRRNVFGNFDVTAEDYSSKIIQELKYTNFISIQPNFETDKGVIADDFIDGAGLYFIYHNDELVYIGHTNHTVRNRIGRWFAAIRGTERFDENHPAGHKFARIFGKKNLNQKLKIIPLVYSTLLSDVTMEDIETQLIYDLKPLLNNEIYRNRDILSVQIQLENPCTIY
jgi:hypothetical protein